MLFALRAFLFLYRVVSHIELLKNKVTVQVFLAHTIIQKQAAFALSQLKDGKGIPILIKIVKNHPGIEVRKNAIFWLGQSNSEEALEALISIVQKNSD